MGPFSKRAVLCRDIATYWPGITLHHFQSNFKSSGIVFHYFLMSNTPDFSSWCHVDVPRAPVLWIPQKIAWHVGHKFDIKTANLGRGEIILIVSVLVVNGAHPFMRYERATELQATWSTSVMDTTASKWTRLTVYSPSAPPKVTILSYAKKKKKKSSRPKKKPHTDIPPSSPQSKVPRT